MDLQAVSLSQIYVKGLDICFTKCVGHPNQMKGTSVHHTNYLCLENCGSKYKNVLQLMEHLKNEQNN